MALNYGSFISYDDFNNLKNRIIAEVKRRSTTELDEELGNDYNQNTFTAIPNIESLSFSDFVQSSYFNKLFEFFNNFKNFPGELNNTYQDALVNHGDIIYALEVLLSIMTNLEHENRMANDDCNIGCMGLCTQKCQNQCTNACTGCTGYCTGCTGECEGCRGCGGECSEGCGVDCGDRCVLTCGYGCANMEWN